MRLPTYLDRAHVAAAYLATGVNALLCVGLQINHWYWAAAGLSVAYFIALVLTLPLPKTSDHDPSGRTDPRRGRQGGRR